MNKFALVLALLLSPLLIHAGDFSQKSVEPSADLLRNTLENARAVPVFKDGKVDGYIIDSPEAGNKDLKLEQGDRLGLEHSDVVTVPNDGQETQE